MRAMLFKTCVAVALLALSSTAVAGKLNENQRRELTVFGLRAMGMQAGPSDVKKVLTGKELKTMVATGINLNGHLCAEITDIRPLKVESAYEVTCVTYSGGSAKKSYVLEALKGIASEM